MSILKVKYFKNRRSNKIFAQGVKQIVDFLGSLVVIILLLLLFLIIAIAIKLDSPGPILFRRKVIGINGKPFDALKFRSMQQNAHELLTQDPVLKEQYQKSLKISNDPRVTRVGNIIRKTSLDELPQLFNILKGDMSLVGPRILGDIELARFGGYGDKVLSVKPGATGLWVVSGRHTVSFERRIELECEYVDRWSLWLDFVILLKTIPAIISGRGAI